MCSHLRRQGLRTCDGVLMAEDYDAYSIVEALTTLQLHAWQTLRSLRVVDDDFPHQLLPWHVDVTDHLVRALVLDRDGYVCQSL